MSSETVFTFTRLQYRAFMQIFIKMEAVCFFSETLASTYNSSKHYTPEDQLWHLLNVKR
jgi:hypothetical protein